MLQWSRITLAQAVAGRAMSLTKNAVSLVSRHNPVAVERVKVSRVTRITACTCPTHSVPANPSPGANTYATDLVT
jgi:hypothetical protein